MQLPALALALLFGRVASQTPESSQNDHAWAPAGPGDRMKTRECYLDGMLTSHSSWPVSDDEYISKPWVHPA